LRDIKDSHLENENDQVQETLISSFNQRYIQISYTSVKFTDRQFKKGQAGYLRSQARRMVKKEKPFMWWWEVREKAKNKVAEWKEKEGKLYT
jgi:hypothetical protein